MMDTLADRIRIDPEEIAAFARRNQIRRLSLFGSVLRPDFGPESDIDVLVEFEPGHTPGFAFVDMQDELSTMLGRHVDLNTPAFLSPRIRQKVLAAAEVLFAAA